MKLIICILLSALLVVGMVSASELGPELVTCGDFSCNDSWSELPEREAGQPLFTQWFRDKGDNQAVLLAPPISTLSDNLSQTLSIKVNKAYNITINVDVESNAANGNQLNITLGGVTNIFFTDENGPSIISKSVTTTTTGDLILDGWDDVGDSIVLNSISVKEIIEAPTVFIRHNNEEILIPYTYFERKENNAWVINLPKVLFRRFKRWIGS